MYRINEAAGCMAGVWTDGDLSDDDVGALVKDLEGRAGEHGPLRLLFRADSRKGWVPSSALQLTRFGLRYSDRIDRLALVGESHLQRCVRLLVTRGAGVRARHFLPAELGRAWQWLQEDEKLATQ